MCLVKLNGNGKFEITQSKYRLTEEQKQEDGEKLFDFCGQCLKAFTDSIQESGESPKGKILPLGFTVCHSSHHFCILLIQTPTLVLVSMLVSGYSLINYLIRDACILAKTKSITAFSSDGQKALAAPTPKVMMLLKCSERV